MILVRAPVRVSLAGGGTDLQSYYAHRGPGLVISTSIDKYFYVFLSRTRSDTVQVSSSDYRRFYRKRRGEAPLWDGNLGLVQAVLDEFGIDEGVSLFLTSEIPPGTGLGSSGTVAVALIKALATLQNRNLTQTEVAELACNIEIERLGAPVGKQDQYQAAFGGLNMITFTSEGTVVEPLRFAPEIRLSLEQRLLLFFTGSSRSSASILAEQQQATEAADATTVEALDAIRQLAQDTRRVLEEGRLAEFGALLAASWEQKKRLTAAVSNPRIDELYDLALSAGATGGKITGAGGGGFLLVYCEPMYQGRVTEALEAQGCFRLDYAFEGGGALVLTNTETDHWAWQGRPVGAAL